MTSFFDYLDCYLDAYYGTADLAAGGPAGADAVDPNAIGPAVDAVPLDLSALADLEAVFGALTPNVDPGADGDPTIGQGSPADAWLSGDEWSGEADLGGSLSSGTVDTSGGDGSVYSVDGEVLDLP